MLIQFNFYVVTLRKNNDINNSLNIYHHEVFNK